MKIHTHSVTLDTDKCLGCTNCVKRCPTEAIRVRDGKATIITEKCIDCGECIRVCPHHAKKAVVDKLKDVLNKFEYTIALPAPTLYAQFTGLRDRNIALTGLKRMGFDDVFEVTVAAEAISAETMKDFEAKKFPKPAISTACPTVVRIIRVRFPSLLDKLIDYRSPMEIAAKWAKRKAMKETGLSKDKIGCIFISPCPAKATAIKMPLGTSDVDVDGIISISEIYPTLAHIMSHLKEDEIEDLARSGPAGVGWAASGGEAAAANVDKILAADGIENVISVLEAIEDGKVHQARLIELNACVGGCVGGVLTVENPFIARARLGHIMEESAPAIPVDDMPYECMHWDEKIEYEPVFEIDKDLSVAMEKLMRIQETEESLSGMDCGACGCPSCHALAEDIVDGVASIEQCIFYMRDKLDKLIDRNEELLDKHVQLLDEHEELQDEFEELEDKHEELQDKHEELQDKHEELQDKHDELQDEFEELEDKHEQLQDEFEELEEELSKKLSGKYAQIFEEEMKK